MLKQTLNTKSDQVQQMHSKGLIQLTVKYSEAGKQFNYSNLFKITGHPQTANSSHPTGLKDRENKELYMQRFKPPFK